MRPQGLPQSALLSPLGPLGPQFAHPHKRVALAFCLHYAQMVKQPHLHQGKL